MGTSEEFNKFHCHVSDDDALDCTSYCVASVGASILSTLDPARSSFIPNLKFRTELKAYKTPHFFLTGIVLHYSPIVSPLRCIRSESVIHKGVSFIDSDSYSKPRHSIRERQYRYHQMLLIRNSRTCALYLTKMNSAREDFRCLVMDDTGHPQFLVSYGE